MHDANTSIDMEVKLIPLFGTRVKQGKSVILREKKTSSKLQFLDDNFYLVTITKNCNANKKIVRATKNYCYFNRYDCGLYRNNARLSVSQIFVAVTESFFFELVLFRDTHVNNHISRELLKRPLNMVVDRFIFVNDQITLFP